jgi:hypothetical protein
MEVFTQSIEKKRACQSKQVNIKNQARIKLFILHSSKYHVIINFQYMCVPILTCLFARTHRPLGGDKTKQIEHGVYTIKGVKDGKVEVEAALGGTEIIPLEDISPMVEDPTKRILQPDNGELVRKANHGNKKARLSDAKCEEAQAKLKREVNPLSLYFPLVAILFLFLVYLYLQHIFIQREVNAELSRENTKLSTSNEIITKKFKKSKALNAVSGCIFLLCLMCI